MDRDPEIRINLLHFPVTVLGPGERIGLWLQGCDLLCEGCIAVHTHDPAGGSAVSVNQLAETILGYRCERLTISGGEPFLQSDVLETLLRRLRESGIKDILVFSGRLFRDLERDHPWVHGLVDALVDGPFIRGNESPLIWKGSDNQEMHIIARDTCLKDAYQAYRQIVKEDKLQYVHESGGYNLLGIPHQYKWESIRHVLRQSMSNMYQDK